MEIIRTTAIGVSVECGSELSMQDLQIALQRDPSILLGAGTMASVSGNFQSLMLLAEGGADVQTKQLAVKQLCAEPAMLAFFAQTLNRPDEAAALVVRDPKLSGVSARLTECILRSLEILNPAEAAAFITPAMAGIFADLLVRIGADGGTLWLLCPGAAALEAVFNPLEPEIAGKRQPLVSGIVSLVLATGEPVSVSGVANHRDHSPAIDIALGKTTHAMIAVPFVLAGTVRGVLTAVRLTHGDPFGERETQLVGYHAEVMANLMVRNLTDQILG
jgi:hypothetical protein